MSRNAGFITAEAEAMIRENNELRSHLEAATRVVEAAAGYVNAEHDESLANAILTERAKQPGGVTITVGGTSPVHDAREALLAALDSYRLLNQTPTPADPGVSRLPGMCASHKPDNLAYIAASDDADRRLALGQRQRQCPTCSRWLWRHEFGPGWDAATQ